MTIQLSDRFTYRKLLRFTLPSMLMMVFTSVYGVVDGFFVSNYVGKTSFAALNLIYPFLMIMGAIGFMFGTGGSALVSKMLGEGKADKANRTFSMLVYVSIALGIALTLVGLVILRPIAVALGAEGEMLEECLVYGRIILLAQTAFILQNEFQSFFVAAEKPQLGLWVTVAAGVTNMVLDAVFVAAFQWGLAGAAAATALSQVVGGVIPLCYFGFTKKNRFHLTKAKLDLRSLGKACVNGSSEMMTNLSMSVVNMLYNYRLMQYAGEDGVAAYGVLMYVNFVFVGLYLGYAIGSAPIISYHYGANHRDELHSLLRKSLVIIGTFAVLMLVLALTLAAPLAQLFVGYDAGLYQLTLHAFRLYSFLFLLAGFSIFGSSFFTALNDGVTSAFLSFLRTLLFQVVLVLALPLLLGLDGIWLSAVAAEALATIVTIVTLIRKRKVFGY